jgi:hypothetical protein
MHYKPKNIAALHIVLGGLPGRMRVEVEQGVKLSVRTVSELRNTAGWPENLAITTPPENLANRCVKVGTANVATRTTPKA